MVRLIPSTRSPSFPYSTVTPSGTMPSSSGGTCPSALPMILASSRFTSRRAVTGSSSPFPSPSRASLSVPATAMSKTFIRPRTG